MNLLKPSLVSVPTSISNSFRMPNEDERLVIYEKLSVKLERIIGQLIITAIFIYFFENIYFRIGYLTLFVFTVLFYEKTSPWKRRPILTIDSKNIQFKKKIPFAFISDTQIKTIRYGFLKKTLLIFKVRNEQIEIPINNLDKSPEEISHFIESIKIHSTNTF